MPKRSCPGAAGAATERSAQRAGALDGALDDGALGRARRALVEGHRDVRAERRLHRHRALGREALRRAVVDRAERDAVVVDREQGVAQREHLEAARVGEDRAVPAHEAVQAAELAHDLLARPQVQVVGVAEHDLRAEARELERVERLDRALRADGHEDRRADRAVRRLERGGAGETRRSRRA